MLIQVLLVVAILLCSGGLAVAESGAHAALHHRDRPEAPRLHIGVLTIPLWGHAKPLLAIAEELAHRGHTVTFFTEQPKWCHRILRHSRHSRPRRWGSDGLEDSDAEVGPSVPAGQWDLQCIEMPRQPAVFATATFHRMSTEYSSTLWSFVDLLEDAFGHHELALPVYQAALTAMHQRQPFTTLLCDLSTYVGASTARYLDLPVVHVYPLTTQLGIGLHPQLPAVGTGYPRQMHWRQRLSNAALKLLLHATAGSTLKRLNEARAANGVPLYRDAYDAAGMYDVIVAPSLWGLDIPHPLCPNVHAVGPLNTRDDRRPYDASHLTPDLLAFLDSCHDGVLYTSFGTLAVLRPETERRLLAALDELPFCVVWRLPITVVTTLPRSLTNRLFSAPWITSTMAVLKHPNLLAFLSHCGDTSVLEAVEAGIPILGLPIFADQADVCQRVAEAGIGIVLGHKFTVSSADITAAVWKVANHHRSSYTNALQKLRLISATLGGASRAADILEDRQYNLLLRRDTTLEACGMLLQHLTTKRVVVTWLAAIAICTSTLLLLPAIHRRTTARPIHKTTTITADTPATHRRTTTAPRRYQPPSTQNQIS